MMGRAARVIGFFALGAAVGCSDNTADKDGTPSTTSSSSGAGGSAATSGGAGGSSATTSGAGGSAGSRSGTGGTSSGAGTGGSTAGSGGGGAGSGATGAGGTIDAGSGAGSGGSAGAGSGGRGGNGGGDAGTGPRTTYVYVSGNGGSIATFTMDPASGSLTPKGTPARVASASFLAWSSPARRLYALSEVDPGRIFAMSIDASNGALAAINDASSGGAGPAHLMVDPTGKWVLAANYGGGTAAVLPVQTNGGIANPVAADIQSFGAGSQPHEIVLDPTGQFAFVPLKGTSANAIAQFRFDGAAGKLIPNAPARVSVVAGAGPRHIAFHPSSKFAYLITEQASTVIAYTHDASGKLAELQTLSTRASAGAGNTTAEIAVHPSGKWLYGSNRGDNDIVQFSLNDADGKMTLVGHTPTGGSTPRHFSIEPAGQFLLVANQDSDNIVVFRIAADGKLTRAGNPVSVAGVMPTFVGAAVVP